MSAKRILVAFGGRSPEHEVSVLTAMQAIAALQTSGRDIQPLYISKSGIWYTGPALLDLSNYQNIDALLKKSKRCWFSQDDFGRVILHSDTKSAWFSKEKSFAPEVVLCAFHGSDGENGAFQGLCEMFNIPYTGFRHGPSANGMHKITARKICKAEGIPIVDGIHFYEQEWAKNEQEFVDSSRKLGFPLIVKPASLGSSIGVARADDAVALVKAVETAFRYDPQVIVEKAIQPLLEINCAVLGTPNDAQPSVCERPVSHSGTLSFADKYQSDSNPGKGMATADRIIPADISEELRAQIQELAVRAFKAFGGTGMARLDFLVNAETQEVFFNEINSIPGSFSFYLWDKSEISFPKLLDNLIRLALEAHREKNGRVLSYSTNLLNQKAAKGIKGLKGK